VHSKMSIIKVKVKWVICEIQIKSVHSKMSIITDKVNWVICEIQIVQVQIKVYTAKWTLSKIKYEMSHPHTWNCASTKNCWSRNGHIGSDAETLQVGAQNLCRAKWTSSK